MTADHVLVKGTYYSESIDAVYGPYTKDHADMLAGQFSDTGCCWTVMPLTDLGQPPEVAPKANPAEREINNTAAVIQVRPNYDQDTRTSRPIAFGFGSPE